jgi:surfactin synthase thioesterase subunit
MSYLVSWPAVAPPDPTPSTPVLLCLPQAGAGAGRFRGWQARLSPLVTVLGVQLPGREERWTDPPPHDLDEVVAAVVDELFRLVDRGRPIVIFGDSFGGLIGYELARVLRPQALIVCVCRAPKYWASTGGITATDVLELVSAVEIDPQLPPSLADEIRHLAAESLNRDVVLSATYRHRSGARLTCPVHAWGAVQDGTVTGRQLDEWEETTIAPCHRYDFDGGHRVSVDDFDTVLARVTSVIETGGLPTLSSPQASGRTT